MNLLGSVQRGAVRLFDNPLLSLSLRIHIRNIGIMGLFYGNVNRACSNVLAALIPCSSVYVCESRRKRAEHLSTDLIRTGRIFALFN